MKNPISTLALLATLVASTAVFANPPASVDKGAGDTLESQMIDRATIHENSGLSIGLIEEMVELAVESHLYDENDDAGLDSNFQLALADAGISLQSILLASKFVH